MILGVIATLVVLGLGLTCHRLRQSNQKLSRTVGWYKKYYLNKQGSHLGFGSYHLMSFDGGKNWYQADGHAHDEVHILGPVDPALLLELQGMEALMDHVISSGPIHLDDPVQAELLTNAGFTIVREQA